MTLMTSARIVLWILVSTVRAASPDDDSEMCRDDEFKSRSTEGSSLVQIYVSSDQQGSAELSTSRSITQANSEQGQTAKDTKGKAAATAGRTRKGSNQKYLQEGGVISHRSSPLWHGTSYNDWLALLAILSLSTILGAVLVFPCGPEFMIHRTCKSVDVLSESTGAGQKGDRLKYCISQENRPLHRGALVAWLLRPWPFIVIVQFLVCMWLPFGHSLPLVAGRLLTGLSTSGSIYLSDKYHNGDKRRDGAEDELYWLRWDITFVSCILSATFQLWTAHLQNRLPLTMLRAAANFQMLVIANWLVTACVMCASRFTLSVKKNASSFILACLAFQYFPAFGYMVWIYSHLNQPLYFSKQTTIWFTFLPGILCYALRRPKDTLEFGYHDVLHTFIVCGLLLSMIWDVYTSAWVSGAVGSLLLSQVGIARA